MSIGAFADKMRVPTNREIISTVGPMWKLWLVLVEHIRAGGRVEEELKFMYGQKYGWALRFRRQGKLLTAFYPIRNGFTVQIILDPTVIEEVQRLRFGKNVCDAVARARPYPEGRWLFVPIESEKDSADMERLLAMKQSRMKRRKVGA